MTLSPESEDLLLGDELAPVTADFGLLEASVQRAVDGYLEWQRPVVARQGLDLQTHRVDGDLRSVLGSLLPLTTMVLRRALFVPTASAWTAYFENGYPQTDPASVMPVLAERLPCRALRVLGEPHTYKDRAGRYGAVGFELFAPRYRAVTLVNDGGRWDFHASGEPLPFEDIERYGERRKTDRFDFALLRRYLSELDARPFDESWYDPSGGAVLVERVGPAPAAMEELTLEQVRDREAARR